MDTIVIAYQLIDSEDKELDRAMTEDEKLLFEEDFNGNITIVAYTYLPNRCIQLTFTAYADKTLAQVRAELIDFVDGIGSTHIDLDEGKSAFITMAVETIDLSYKLIDNNEVEIVRELKPLEQQVFEIFIDEDNLHTIQKKFVYTPPQRITMTYTIKPNVSREQVIEWINTDNVVRVDTKLVAHLTVE